MIPPGAGREGGLRMRDRPSRAGTLRTECDTRSYER
jgi:hypothetical protein